MKFCMFRLFLFYFIIFWSLGYGLVGNGSFYQPPSLETDSTDSRACLNLDENTCKTDSAICFWAGSICENLLRGSNLSTSSRLDTSNACNVINSPQLPSVTIAVATYKKRHGYHRYLYDSFRQQDYQGPLTLIVYDNANVPSSFFTALNDPKVTYQHTTQTPTQLSLGAKRNWLADNASGEIVVVFDDDDFYGSNYVSFMVSEMKRTGASLIRAKTWLMSHFNESGRDLTYHMVTPVGTETGWGFAFVFKKSIMTSCRYADLNRLEEDSLADCVNNNPTMEMVSIEFDTLNKKPLMLKFESYTPKSVAPAYLWSGAGGSYERFYGDPATGRLPGQEFTKPQILNIFSSQQSLVKKYIFFYKKMSKKYFYKISELQSLDLLYHRL